MSESHNVMYLIVGLGNPGPQYEKNRHNIGFMLIDELARDPAFGPEKKAFDGVVSEGQIDTAKGRDKLLLLKPMTFMNLSGNSVVKAMQFYKLKPEQVIVFHDELDLAPGRLRIPKPVPTRRTPCSPTSPAPCSSSGKRATRCRSCSTG